MEYTSIKTENKIAGYKTRIRQLEEEHFSNEVYAEEAELVDDEASYNHFVELNKSVETRIKGLTAKVNELSELAKIENSEEQQNGNSE